MQCTKFSNNGKRQNSRSSTSGSNSCRGNNNNNKMKMLRPASCVIRQPWQSKEQRSSSSSGRSSNITAATAWQQCRGSNSVATCCVSSRAGGCSCARNNCVASPLFPPLNRLPPPLPLLTKLLPSQQSRICNLKKK